jgi:protein-S-isoprenylcysteine O-methyltransferase Ste14
LARLAVTAVSLLLTGATAASAVTGWHDAVVDPAVRAGAVAGYLLLKTAVVAAFTFFVAVRAPARRPSRDPLAFLACAAAIGGLVALRQPSDASSATQVVAGDLVTLAACAWLLFSVVKLGRCFGVLPEARGLVTTGPYSVVRHPVYLGELGACAGLVLAAPSAWNFVAALVFVSAQTIRMRLEEAALASEFSEYPEYAARTPRIIPSLLAGRVSPASHATTAAPIARRP